MTCDSLLTVKEVARLLRVSVATIWRYTKRGTLPKPIRIDGHTWWIEAEVLAVIEKGKAARQIPLAAKHLSPDPTKTRTNKKRVRVRLEEAA
jgi:excisionase family DNA binding protein